jgi:hypothetical protein
LSGVEARFRAAKRKIVRQGKQKRYTPEILHPLENLVGIFLPFNPERETMNLGVIRPGIIHSDTPLTLIWLDIEYMREHNIVDVKTIPLTSSRRQIECSALDYMLNRLQILLATHHIA